MSSTTKRLAGGDVPERVCSGTAWGRRGLAVAVLPAAALIFSAAALMAAGYEDNGALSERLRQVALRHPEVVRVRPLAESLGKQPVWLAEIGAGGDEARSQRPALLVVAGLEGHDLAGSAMVAAWIQSLAEAYATNAEVQRLLQTTTFYAVPRVNPDAAAAFFATPRAETSVNGRPVDDDHDGLVDEDGPDDLNGDGRITWMRVEDAEGEYILDPAEPRLLLKADRLKGERGSWRLLPEGRDDDHDQAWNEDGRGGVNFNRNFPYRYSYFSPWAGLYPMSEAETRALAEFVVDHPNIGIAFAFGDADNLTQTPKDEPPKRPPTALHPDDAPYYRELGKAYRQSLGLEKELPGNSEPGSWPDWLYYHRGRLSLSARAWSPALQVELAKRQKRPEAEEAGKGEAKGEAKAEEKKPASQDEGRGREERAFLKWVLAEAPAEFVEWKAVEHPDFPGKKVEIGGLAPYARSNPPEKELDGLSARHGAFLTQLAGRLPRLGIRRAEVKSLGQDVYDITVVVENTGYLPTALAQGELSREVLPTRVVFGAEEKSVLAGTRQSLLGPIAGSGGSREVRVVLHLPGRQTVEVEAVSALGGTVRRTLELQSTK